MLLGIDLQSKQPAQNWADHHGGRPYLMWRTRRKRLVVISRQHFCKVAESAIKAKQGVGPQVLIGRESAMVAVFADRCPTSKQRPDRTVVVTRTIVDLRMVGDDPHAPVRLMILGREFRNGLVSVIWFR